jgi:hypothetical protein
VVDFTFTDDEGESTVVTKTAPLRVVAPITLTAILTNNSGTVTDLTVWFVIGPDKIEGSEQTITINEKSSKTITYDYVPAVPLGEGEYKVSVHADSGILGANPEDNLISAQVTNFYVGQSDYSFIEILFVIVLVVLAIVTLFIYRKPVKNIGKPKSRR